MSDEAKSNLEPIEENDLNLAGKFGPAKEGPDFSESRPEMTVPLERKPEKELPAERPAEKEHFYNKILSQVKSAPQSDNKEETVKADAETIASGEKDAAGKINRLVKLASSKGLAHAVKVARRLEDFYLLDEFHDRLLSEELHQALVKKGIIKEI